MVDTRTENFSTTRNRIPVIDIFAGPGGLGEGFSSVLENGELLFDIKLSIEKDPVAHKTLKLRSFYRQFLRRGKEVPEEYYELIRETDIKAREIKLKELFENSKFRKEAEEADKEAQNIELGGEKHPPQEVDKLITEALRESRKRWVLIGGPPCQAYSLAGRARMGGVNEGDPRVYLYKQYLRIIAKHQPSVFVMENVKGLLSATLHGEKIFHMILEDLSNPSSVFTDTNCPGYKVYSLVKSEVKDDKDFLIRAEEYGVPQKRHRVILLGIRSDIKKKPEILQPSEEVTLQSVIGKLPELRSGINRGFVKSEIVNGKKKRYYNSVEDSCLKWEEVINTFKDDILSWNGFLGKESPERISSPAYRTGSEFLEAKDTLGLARDHDLHKWYLDERLNGIPNHDSRTHLVEDLKRYLFASIFTREYKSFPRLRDYEKHNEELLPDHENVKSGKFADRFRVQLPDKPATTVTSHISKDGHYFIHYDPKQCRSLTVREAARIQTFPDNYLFCGSRTQQYHQVGNAVPPYLAKQIGEIVKKLFL